MKKYEVRKRISYNDIAKIDIDNKTLNLMSDNDILRVVNRMLVLNNAKVRIKVIDSRDDSYNMITTDNEVIIFLCHVSGVTIKYCTYSYIFALEEVH